MAITPESQEHFLKHTQMNSCGSQHMYTSVLHYLCESGSDLVSACSLCGRKLLRQIHLKRLRQQTAYGMLWSARIMPSGKASSAVQYKKNREKMNL